MFFQDNLLPLDDSRFKDLSYSSDNNPMSHLFHKPEFDGFLLRDTLFDDRKNQKPVIPHGFDLDPPYKLPQMEAEKVIIPSLLIQQYEKKQTEDVRRLQSSSTCYPTLHLQEKSAEVLLASAVKAHFQQSQVSQENSHQQKYMTSTKLDYAQIVSNAASVATNYQVPYEYTTSITQQDNMCSVCYVTDNRGRSWGKKKYENRNYIMCRKCYVSQFPSRNYFTFSINNQGKPILTRNKKKNK